MQYWVWNHGAWISRIINSDERQHKRCMPYMLSVFFWLQYLFTAVFINWRIVSIKVFRIKSILNPSECFAETLEMHNLTFTKETYRVGNFRIFNESENIVIGASCFLFCCHIFIQICKRVPFALEFTRIERNSTGCLRPYSKRMVYIVFVKAWCSYLVRSKIFCKLMNNRSNNFKMCQFFCTYRSIVNVPVYLK